MLIHQINIVYLPVHKTPISLMILKGMNGTTEKKGTNQIEKNMDIILKMISAVVLTPTAYQLNISM